MMLATIAVAVAIKHGEAICPCCEGEGRYAAEVFVMGDWKTYGSVNVCAGCAKIAQRVQRAPAEFYASELKDIADSLEEFAVSRFRDYETRMAVVGRIRAIADEVKRMQGVELQEADKCQKSK